MSYHIQDSDSFMIDFRAFELVHSLVVILDAAGNISAINSFAANLLSLPVAALIGKNWFSQFIPIDEQLLTQKTINQMLAQQTKANASFKNHIMSQDSAQHLIQWCITCIHNRNAHANYALLVGEDITDHQQQESALALYSCIFNHTQEAIMITDADGVIQEVNDSFVRITGYNRSEAIGNNPSFMQSGKHTADFYQLMWKKLAEDGIWDGEIINRHKNGAIWAEQLTIKAIFNADKKNSHYLAFFTDITAQKESQALVSAMEFHDILTQLPNRTLLAKRLTHAMLQTLESHQLLAICYLDLDDLKPVNDRFGHEHGDQLLVAVADRLRRLMHKQDTVARLGGDEFVLLLNQHDSIDSIIGHLTDIILALNKPYSINEQTHHITASIGVAIYPNDAIEADALLRNADHAMYQAKRNGRNRYHLFDAEKDKQAQQQRATVERFTQAIATEELRLYFQPKVNMHTGEVLGAEALVRWQHPNQGLLPPAAFLPFIENSEVMPLLDRWVLTSALKHIAYWQQESQQSLCVSVNISASTLQEESFQHYLQEQLRLFPSIDPTQLELEVLESSALNDLSAAAHVIDACHQLGVNFALDDFGTGYSSLTYLRRLSVNTLKIDQSFVRNMLSDAEDLTIVQGVIALAKAFDLDVIAEGVETAAHGAMLLKLGCPIAQGYGIARPMPADDLLNWIRRFEPSPIWKSIDQLVILPHDLPLITAEIDHQIWVDKVVN